ncbi:MAG: 1-deoxy-D-xylulose-5-phosphate synthase [Chloroflexi bacterium]|nr:1-deoxy-D-xylulose-5-phosphate synthase [Chloroflexota bacterium]
MLDNIASPADLRGLRQAELVTLAQEIRECLVATVSQNGGHLASNLGVVELTLALHRVFDSPRDKILWDVGHQSYTHKLITGRGPLFHTLRQHGGISGFPDPAESPHDVVACGHASTALSTAMGVALARDLAGEKYHVLAVVGDGALTGGMAFEALNHIGQRGTRLIVVLNDNGMSISPTVGALARRLSKFRMDHRYQRAKVDARRAVTSLPLGDRAWDSAKFLKNRLKRLVLPTLMWEELGFSYMGPLDGHDLAALEAALRQAKEYSERPVVLHVITQKGKGFAPAEGDAVRYHGVSPAGAPKILSYSEVFARTVLRLAREDPRVVAITAAMLGGTGLEAVAKEFPQRVFDVGICEQHAVTMAAGLASQGYVPIVAVYSTFLQRAFDQIVHDVCLQRLPVVFAVDRAGIVGDDGKTHQGSFDLSYLGLIPNLIVAAPADEDELQHLLHTAVRAGAPMAVRYPRGSGPGVEPSAHLRELPVGRWVVLREGHDLAIVGIGATVAPALAAADVLASQGVEATVVNARYAKPLDEELLRDVATQTGRVLVAEENTVWGGLGSQVRACLTGMAGVRLECLGLPDAFIEHGSQEELRARFGLDAAGIARCARESFPNLSAAPSSTWSA